MPHDRTWIVEGVQRVLNKKIGMAQCYVAAWVGGEFGEKWVHVYVWLSPFAVYLKLSQHC